MLPNKLSPRVQAGIAFALLAMFAGIMFLPAWLTAFKVDADTKQTLFTLVTAVVFFFIGKNTDSANRDAQITAAAIAPVPPPPAPAPIVQEPLKVRVDDTKPVSVEVKNP